MFQKYKSLYALMQAFPDEKACIDHLEKLRWAKGIVCPLCSSTRKFHRITRGNLYKCAECEKSFSVRKSTIFEESRLPLRKWFMAHWLITENRKGINSCQLARELGVTQKTAWFMLGRLREVAAAMSATSGTLSGTVEADETYIGGKEKNKHSNKKLRHGRGAVGKQAVLGVVERGGKIKTSLTENVKQEDLRKFVERFVSPGSNFYTDDFGGYIGLNNYKHESVNHSGGECVRGDIHTNGIESFWALFKRGYHGVFHKITKKHGHRYLAEFEMRWNMIRSLQGTRFDAMLESVAGLRLTYQKLIA